MAKKNEVTTSFSADISQFKENIIQAKNAISSANAEFKNASASMDVFGRSADGVTAQIEAQRKKLAAQNEILENLKNEYALVAKEQGENSDAALKLANQITNQETQILKTQKSLNKLETDYEKVSKAEEMTAENGLTVEQNLKALEKAEKKAEEEAVKLAAGLDDAGDSAKTAGEDAEKSGDGFTVLKGVMANLATEVIKMAVDGLKQLGTELVNVTKEASAYADEISTMSTVTGISTEKLQEMRYMAELVDVSVETVTGSMTKLEKNMYNAANGNKSMAEAFKQLGVSVQNSDGSFRDNEDVFNDVIDALGKMQDETERDAVAMTVLGKSAKDLTPLIAAGKDRIAELKDEAHEMGYVLGDEALDSLNSLNDTLDTLNAVTEGVKNQIGALAADTVKGLLSPLIEQLAQIPEAAKTSGISGVVDVISQMVNGILTELKTNAPQIGQAGAELMVSIVNGITENLPLLLSAALTIILTLAQDLGESLPDMIPAIVDMMLEIVDVLIDNIDMLTDAAIAIILGLAEGLIKALPKLIAKAPEIVAKLTKALMDNAPKLVDAAVELITMLTEYLANPENTETLINSTIEILGILVNAFIENLPLLVESAIEIMTALGGYFIEQAHLMTEKAPELIEKLVEAFKSLDILDKLKNLGSDIIGGVEKGIKKSYENATKWGKDLVDNFISGVKSKFDDIKGAFNNLGYLIKERIHFSEPDEGPLSDFSTYAPDMIDLFIYGLTQSKNKLAAAVSDIAGVIKTSMQADIDALGDFTLNTRTAGAGISGGGSGQVVNNYNYTQNISSPKPVSRLETYRQTKNLLSLTRGAMV